MLTFGRIETPIDGENVGRATEDPLVPLDGGNEERRVRLSGNDADVRHDSPFCFLHENKRAELRRATKLSASVNLRARLEEAQDLPGRVRDAADDPRSSL